MKIGILTFHYAHNFGAALQAYGLCTYLREKGHDVRFVDYESPAIRDVYRRYSLPEFWRTNVKKRGLVRGTWSTLRLYPAHMAKQPRRDKFESFIKRRLPSTAPVNNPEEVNALGLDLIVCGSDQIWNPTLTDTLDPMYFCDGINPTTRRATYAASNGRDDVAERHLAMFDRLMANFDHVSIRERGLSEFVASRGFKNTLVSDPIFLLRPEQWEEMAKLPDDDNYVLSYSFIESPGYFEYLRDVADKLGKKLIIMGPNKKTLPYDAKQVWLCGPEEFVGYFLKADYVVSNSFHGTAFSILLHKRFSCFMPNVNRSRVDSLLDTFGQRSRLVGDGNTPELSYDVDSTAIENALAPLRKISETYLEEITR